MPAQDYLNGKLLIAMPNMTDPRFEQAVVFIFSHDDDHALGVVVNKPQENLAFGEILESLGIEAGPQVTRAPVFEGGPVQADRGLVVHSLDYASPTTLQSAGIGVSGDEALLREIAGADPDRSPRRWRFIIGCAGWGPGQLESEIAANVWLHLDADEKLMFDEEPNVAWRRALQALNVTEAMFSTEWSNVRDPEAPLN